LHSPHQGSLLANAAVAVDGQVESPDVWALMSSR
jgi:hypothetical protein